METKKIDLKLNDYEGCGNLTLMLHSPSPEMIKKNRPTILVIPGGGYSFVSDREADPIALAFMAEGYHVAILRYSIAPARFPVSFLEAFTALKHLKDHTAEYEIDKENIYVIGFSAGGHLAALTGTSFNHPLVLEKLGVEKDALKPAGMILSYPVITSGEFAHRGSFDSLLGDHKDDPKWLYNMSIENLVAEDTVPTFIWATFADTTVPVENTLLMCDALRKKGVAFEQHIFPVGAHGLSLADDRTTDWNGGGTNPYCCKWFSLCLDWLKLNIEK